MQFKRRGQKEQFDGKLYSYQHECASNTWSWLSSWPLHPAIPDIIKKEGQPPNRQISQSTSAVYSRPWGWVKALHSEKELYYFSKKIAFTNFKFLKNISIKIKMYFSIKITKKYVINILHTYIRGLQRIPISILFTFFLFVPYYFKYSSIFSIECLIILLSIPCSLQGTATRKLFPVF